MPLAIFPVLSADYGAVGGETIIPFVITKALDSIWDSHDKHVHLYTCQLNRHCKHPCVCRTWIRSGSQRIDLRRLRDANTRTPTIPPYRHIHPFTPINDLISTWSIIVREGISTTGTWPTISHIRHPHTSNTYVFNITERRDSHPLTTYKLPDASEPMPTN